MGRASLAVLLLLVSWALAACQPIAVDLSRPEPNAGIGKLLVGAARRDITPIPGYPMGGHSFEGRYALGNLGRLYARAIYLEDPNGEPVVLMSADVWAVSLGLRDRVVELVQREHGLAHIGRQHVIIGATHTHHSPAANASNHVYNIAAGKIWAFDHDLFEFLARSMALAIVEAHASREPAKLRVSRPTVADFARNRSIEPFDENPEADEIVAGNTSLPACTLSSWTPQPRACKAVDPSVAVLLAEAVGERRLIAAGVFMAVHATAMPNSTVFYQGDVFGLTALDLERRLAEEGAPVVAVFNGAEGDVSPTWDRQSYAAALAVSDRIAAGLWPQFEAWKAQQGEPTEIAATRFEARHGLFRLTGQSFTDAHGHDRVTAEHGMVGSSILAGAEDGPTSLRKRIPEGTRRRRPRPDKHGHGHKRRMIVQSSDRMLPPEAPLSVIDLDGLKIVALPGEFTTTMGRRIQRSLAAGTGQEAHDIVLVGLANEYRSYFTTPEEYELQYYEGASTMYGTHAGSLVEVRVKCLGDSGAECGQLDYPLSRDYAPGPETRTGFVEHPRSARWLRRHAAELEDAVGAPGSLGRPVLRIDDVAPRWPRPETMVPTASVEIANGCAWEPHLASGVPQTEAAYRIVNLVRRVGPSRWRWASTWLTPELTTGSLARLKVVGVDGASRCSPVFSRGDLEQASGGTIEYEDVGCQPVPGCG